MYRILRNNIWLDVIIFMVNFIGVVIVVDSYCKIVFEAINWYIGFGLVGV